MTTLIKNGKVVFPSGVKTASILIRDGKIAQVGDISAAADEVIDAEGSFVCPGFIDMHTHGAGGSDFMDGTVEAYLTASKMQARHGATLVYPTTLTSSNEELFEMIDIPQDKISDTLRVSGRHVSVDAPFVEGEDNSLLDVIPNDDSPMADRGLVNESLSTEIERSLQILTTREREIIKSFFGIGCQEMTLEEIGERLDLTRERVRQIKEKAIRKLKKPSASKLLKTYLG